MQKVINPNHLDSYFSASQYSDNIGGSLAKFSDVQHLKTYADIYNGLRLDYEGTKFVKPGVNEDSVMYAIRFTTNQADNIHISYTSPDLGTHTYPPPYTGNGFISSAEELLVDSIPGKVIKEGNQLIPEYIVPDSKTVVFNNGAEMYKITETGEEILYAIFDKDIGFFKKIGE